MTKTARVYGGSLYDLAAEEKLDGQIMEQMIAVRQIFRENPGYLKLLGEPAIPEDERLKMIEEMLKEASSQVTAMKEKAEKDIAQEKRKAVNEIKGEIGGMAVEIAGKVIEREISEEDHAKLIDEFIENVGEAS